MAKAKPGAVTRRPATRAQPAPYYRERATDDVIRFIYDAAHLPTRNDEIATPNLPKAIAYAFRKRLYYWKRSVLDTMAKVETDEQRECIAFVTNGCGKRVNAEWLNLLGFRVDETGDGTYRVVAFLKPICYGPDIVFADQEAATVASGVEWFKQMMKERQNVPRAQTPS
jgi:hypothetical protein